MLCSILALADDPLSGMIDHVDDHADDLVVFDIQISGGIRLEVFALNGELKPDLGFSRLGLRI